MFDYQVQIRFRDADPAGIMFFARAFDLAHDAYEEFLKSLGHEFKDIFLNSQMAIPLVRAESDYKKPLLAGQAYCVRVSTARVGESSFSIRYDFLKGTELHAQLQTHHVCIDTQSHKKINIPAPLRSQLSEHLITG